MRIETQQDVHSDKNNFESLIGKPRVNTRKVDYEMFARSRDATQQRIYKALPLKDLVRHDKDRMNYETNLKSPLFYYENTVD